MRYDNVAVLIPAFNPDYRMITFIMGLQERGFSKIIIIDDESDDRSRQWFEQAELLGATISRNKKTMGNGNAIRKAIVTTDCYEVAPEFFITAFCDGSHSPEDVEKVAKELIRKPGKLILGIRKFENAYGKRVSYWLNFFQKAFFGITNKGKQCPDPGSGLIGFSAELKDLALGTEGNSRDYEMNFLDSASQQDVLSFVPVSTNIPDRTKAQSTKMVFQTLGMYSKFWRYMGTSIAAMVVDVILFAIFKNKLVSLGFATVFMATVFARIISGIVGYVLNRYISFRSRLSPGPEMVRYFIVFFGQMATSGLIVSVLNLLPTPTVVMKILVDFVLFFVVYNLQKAWVFASKN